MNDVLMDINARREREATENIRMLFTALGIDNTDWDEVFEVIPNLAARLPNKMVTKDVDYARLMEACQEVFGERSPLGWFYTLLAFPGLFAYTLGIITRQTSEDEMYRLLGTLNCCFALPFGVRGYAVGLQNVFGILLQEYAHRSRYLSPERSVGMGYLEPTFGLDYGRRIYSIGSQADAM
jgi:hypothetical protein